MNERKIEDVNEYIDTPLTYMEAMDMARIWWREKGRSIFNYRDLDDDAKIESLIESFAHDLHERGLLNRGSAINPV